MAGNGKKIAIIGTIIVVLIGVTLLILWATGVFSNRTHPVPTPTPTSTPTPTGTSNWAPVKTRASGDSDVQWSAKIYDAVTGTPHSTAAGGVVTNVPWLHGMDSLDQNLATNLCPSPCYWDYAKGDQNQKDLINKAALCDCEKSIAINF